MVHETELEPVTFALEGRCSSTELRGRAKEKKRQKNSIQKIENNNGKFVEHAFYE